MVLLTKPSGGGRRLPRQTNLLVHPTLNLFCRCAVCREEYQRGEAVASLSCGHFYHPLCIAQWLQHQKVRRLVWFAAHWSDLLSSFGFWLTVARRVSSLGRRASKVLPQAAACRPAVALVTGTQCCAGRALPNGCLSFTILHIVPHFNHSFKLVQLPIEHGNLPQAHLDPS